MPKSHIAIAIKEATAGNNIIEIGLSAGKLVAVEVETTGEAKAYAYLNAKIRPGPAISFIPHTPIGDDIGLQHSGLWWGQVHVELGMWLIAEFENCAAGDTLTVRYILEI